MQSSNGLSVELCDVHVIESDLRVRASESRTVGNVPRQLRYL